MKKSEIAVWIKFFILCIFGLGTAIFVFFFFNNNTIFTKASGAQASLSFNPSDMVVIKDSIVTTQVIVDVEGGYIRGSDVKIVFDPSRLVLIKIRPLAQEQTAFKTYLPVDEFKNFDEVSVIRKANSEGIIEFSAVAADMKNKKVTEAVTGSVALAELSFVVKKEDNANVAFLTNHLTLDSTAVQVGDPPINILTKSNLFMIVVEGITPTPPVPTSKK